MRIVIIVLLVGLSLYAARFVLRAFREHSGPLATRGIWWSLGTAAASLLCAAIQLVSTFGAVASAPTPEAKANVLNDGIHQAMSNTQPFLLLGLLLAFSAGVARGLYGKTAQPKPSV
jgi:hypothetical protein